jgi:hypothetical protein
MGKFIEKMNIVPDNLSLRLESLFHTPAGSAAHALQELVRETVELVELHMPQIDTSQVRRKLDSKRQAWKLLT